MRIRLTIRGAVQGVGFRPFVYRLASSLGVFGWVANSNQGLVIEAEARPGTLFEFCRRIANDHPAHASIASMEQSVIDVKGSTAFEIRDSQAAGRKSALILPDIATCRECIEDIFNPAGRRYLYPFTNCTNCGPRFSIIDDLPYDRASTTMRAFTMCESCRREYEDPADRRFHAQPNACADCGPMVAIVDGDGRTIERGHDAITIAAELIGSGKIVAVKGLGGFHLFVDAGDQRAVERLRQRKQREAKPLAVMAPGLDWIRTACQVDGCEQQLLQSAEAPIVLLRSKAGALPDAVAPGNPYLGVMLPYTPLHHVLMRRMEKPVVATSGNRSDEPICIDEADAFVRLHGIADAFLIHDRPIRRHVDDSIVRVLLGAPQILRRARGYTPSPLTMHHALPSTLAVGAHLKNAIALAVPDPSGSSTRVFISQHIGDLQTPEAFAAFRNVIDDLQRALDVQAETVLCDAHPDYTSTHYAASFKPIQCQHHTAHVAACMADNQVAPPALGVAWDGSGWGLDGTLWGGEFLRVNAGSFSRAAHFRTFPLPGGDAASKRPDYVAAGLLFEMLGPKAFDGSEPPLLRKMLERNFRTFRTSSVGRLFDAVACITGIHRDVTSFEGQAAMQLEFAVVPGVSNGYPFELGSQNPVIVDWEPMIRAILADRANGISPGVIAARFHNTLADIVVAVASVVGERRVLLTGGCFQNRYLTEQTVNRLNQAGHSPYWHRRIPTNDGGIAFGQIAAHAFEQEAEVLHRRSQCVSLSQAN